MEKQVLVRDKSIDILRGLAIVFMVMGNLEPILASPHPFWLRLYGSFAAPLFIITAGMMVAITSNKPGRNLKYYLVRGGLIILIGALIDIFAWGLIPFVTIDVLYLIGLAIPLSYLISKLKNIQLLLIITLIFGLTVCFQSWLGYGAYPEAETDLNEINTVNLDTMKMAGKHWLIDGWFPIFPWLGLAFFGAFIGRIKSNLFSSKNIKYYGWLLMAIALPLWFAYPGALYEREGYSELFYPPSLGFILFSLGLFLSLLYFFARTQSWRGYILLTVLGEASLFMYIFHSLVLAWFVSKIWEDTRIISLLIIYFVLVSLMVLLGFIIKNIKAKYQLDSFLLRFILGS
ncbi:MAG: DUF1624 domain-containing protein [Gomphosphaeria aponina SAG 52.96 = DSM 107014]|uniref:DUF1624 domain-containing protein n=1 Tax=Gomphosphaeria aponina SAG 52.96 = DSM 107014 TaxID=1521640 RepID=A0A941JPZ1_9CHRO|nr:DUF1624 domain-containing protein [Gomphosphaeria aponina SAG 52.96 = DSM 107014]